MAFVLLIILIGVPLLEIAVLIRVGGVIGVWPTVGLVVLTAVAGSWLIRLQGLGVLARAQAALANDVLPVAELFNGLCLIVAGVLLITPGFVTDTAGFILLIPAARQVVGRWLWRVLQARGQVRVWSTRRGPHAERPRNDGVIEGEYEDVTPTPRDENDDDDEPDSLPRQPRERR